MVIGGLFQMLVSDVTSLSIRRGTDSDSDVADHYLEEVADVAGFLAVNLGSNWLGHGIRYRQPESSTTLTI